MAAGIVNLANLANTIQEKFDKPFINLRDTRNTFLARIPKKDWNKATYDWLVRAAQYSAVWSAAEADQTSFIAGPAAGGVGPVATDGVGTATAFLAPNNHPFLRPSITMRMLYAAVQVTGLTDAAMGGNGSSYVKAVADETEQAMLDFWRQTNLVALGTATTASNSGKDIDSLGVLFNTTSYAGVTVAATPEWNPSVDSTTTVLTVAAMQSMYNNLMGGTQTLGTSNTIRDATIKEIWTSPAQWTAYGNLLTGLRRYRPADTLDGGVGDYDTALEFNGVPVVMIQRFPAGYMIFYGGGMYYVVLKSLGTSDKSSNFVDATFLELSHYANLALRSRKDQGLMTALT